MRVFDTEKHERKKETMVRYPNSCVVTCAGCDDICPVGAISHPSKKEFLEKIRALRNSSNHKSRKDKE